MVDSGGGGLEVAVIPTSWRKGDEKSCRRYNARERAEVFCPTRTRL